MNEASDVMNEAFEDEIVYRFDMCNPRVAYLKPLYGRVSRKTRPLRLTMFAVITGEVAAMAFLEKTSQKSLWIVFLSIISILWFFYLYLIPKKRRERYEKIHAAGEDSFSYTFYKDSVKVKSPTTEVVLKYDTAEFFAENDERMMIVFPLGRSISIDKTQCDEERLAFFRSIVPEENQNKVEKKTARKQAVESVVLVLYAAVMAVLITATVKLNARPYRSEYPNTTYISFEACLHQGTITDVVIIEDKYVEYTFTGREADKRYYTVCEDDIERLKQELDHLGVDWRNG